MGCCGRGSELNPSTGKDGNEVIEPTQMQDQLQHLIFLAQSHVNESASSTDLASAEKEGSQSHNSTVFHSIGGNVPTSPLGVNPLQHSGRGKQVSPSSGLEADGEGVQNPLRESQQLSQDADIETEKKETSIPSKDRAAGLTHDQAGDQVFDNYPGDSNSAGPDSAAHELIHPGNDSDLDFRSGLSQMKIVSATQTHNDQANEEQAEAQQDQLAESIEGNHGEQGSAASGITGSSQIKEDSVDAISPAGRGQPHAPGFVAKVAHRSRPKSAIFSHTSEGRTSVGESEGRSLALYHMYQKTVHDERSKVAKRSRPNSANPSNPGHCRPIETETAPSVEGNHAERRRVARSRPNSAQLMESERVTERLRIQLQKPVRSWDVAEVSDWVSAIGLPQYRKRFIHQHISGILLLKLTHSNLKADLEIGVLGHRDMLLTAIKTLPRLKSGSSPVPLQQTPFSIESQELSILKAKLHRQKLLKELEKAELHTASLYNKLEGTSRQAELADEEVLHIRGSITSLENSFHWPHSSPLGAHRDISPGLRHASGIIPWHPNGAPFELTIPKIEREESLSPVKSRPSSALHPKPQPGNGLRPASPASPSAFLDRVTRDLQARQYRLKEMKKMYHSPEAVLGNQSYSMEARAADLKTLSTKLHTSLGVKLVDLQSGKVVLSKLKPNEQLNIATSLDVQPATSPSAVLRQDQENASELASVPPQPPQTSPGLVTEGPTVQRHPSDVPEDTCIPTTANSGGLASIAEDSGTPLLHPSPFSPPPELSQRHQAGNPVGPQLPLLSHQPSSRAARRSGAHLLGSSVKFEEHQGQSSNDLDAEGFIADRNGGQSLTSVMDYLAAELPARVNLTDQQAQSVLTAKGEDRKLHSFAAAVREANFLGRHAVDLSVREERMRQLRHHWREVEMQSAPVPKGRGQKVFKPALTQVQRDEADIESCQLLFSQAGWPAADFKQQEGARADKKLDSVLVRAQVAAQAAIVKKTKGIASALPDFDDGLDELQASFVEEKQAKAEDTSSVQADEPMPRRSTADSEATHAAMTRLASTSRSSYTSGDQESLSERPAASASAVSQAEDVAAKIFHAFSQTLPKDSSQDDVLGSVVRQLARCRLDELEKLARHKGQRKQLAIYRALLMQRFLQDIEVDTKKRNDKVEAALNAIGSGNKKLSKEAADAFFARLQADGDRRQKAREEASKAAQEAEAAKLEASRKELKDLLISGRAKAAAAAAAAHISRPASALNRQRSAAFALPVTLRRPASARP